MYHFDNNSWMSDVYGSIAIADQTIVDDSRNTVTLIESDLSCLHNIHKFVSEVLSTTELAYTWKGDRFGKQQLIRHSLSKYMSQMPVFLRILNTDFEFSESIEIFKECAIRMDLMHENFKMGLNFPSCIENKTVADRFNDFIQFIRLESNNPIYEKRRRYREYNAIRNYRSACRYLDNLFQRYSRLVVIRIDLGYLHEYAKKFDFIAADRDIEKLLNNRRYNKLISNWAGYMCKMEIGVAKGVHFHLIVFLEGSKFKDDVGWGNKIGGYWNRITSGNGVFHNCNRTKVNYKSIGVGIINHDNEAMITTLKNIVIAYLTKEQEIFSLSALQGRTRTFRRGVILRSRNCSGRPRKVKNV